jgi:hypothetical protein
MTSFAFVVPWARYYSMHASLNAKGWQHRALGGARRRTGAGDRLLPRPAVDRPAADRRQLPAKPR